MIRINGRKALITGGSRGIGRATAILFSKAGCDVAINYINQKTAADSVRRQVERLGRECLVFKTDVSQEEEVNLMIKEIIRKWNQIDIVVNNAGIWTYGEMGNMTKNTWEETLAINLSGVFHVCNAVVPLMKEKKRGWIINVSSTAGVRGEAFHSHYAASKGALISLTKSLAVELSPYNILVNCVAPGWVETDMCSKVFNSSGFRKRVQKSIPLNRIPLPEDIAGPILFLASDLARHITGEILNVNGGSVLCG